LLLKPDLDFIRQVRRDGGDTLKKCYQCATCSVVCELSSADHPFPRRQMMLAQWGLKDALLADPSVWLCHQCQDCATRCPRQAKPGDVLGAIRSYAFQHFAVPSFMGRALASPAALLPLFLVPVMILIALFYRASGGDFGYVFETAGEVDYARFIPHGILEMLFIGGNILIFAFAAIGLFRFWNNLNNNAGAAQKGFISAFLETAIELIPHGKFSKCTESKPRQWGHLLMFYGFIGSMATAGIALFSTVLLKELGSPYYLDSPINFPNPIKILGGASGLAMLVGGWLLISQRLKGRPEVRSSGYNDWLFLIIISLVGLTGMGTWLLRLAEIPIVAYPIYFIHLTLVFFLLWYAPYSKFAHMFYRTLALTYAKSAGMDLPRTKKAA
jgi:quinone-modifying oxidoreductase subunit QmoC